MANLTTQATTPLRQISPYPNQQVRFVIQPQQPGARAGMHIANNQMLTAATAPQHGNLPPQTVLPGYNGHQMVRLQLQPGAAQSNVQVNPQHYIMSAKTQQANGPIPNTGGS